MLIRCNGEWGAAVKDAVPWVSGWLLPSSALVKIGLTPTALTAKAFAALGSHRHTFSTFRLSPPTTFAPRFCAGCCTTSQRTHGRAQWQTRWQAVRAGLCGLLALRIRAHTRRWKRRWPSAVLLTSRRATRRRMLAAKAHVPQERVVYRSRPPQASAVQQRPQTVRLCDGGTTTLHDRPASSRASTRRRPALHPHVCVARHAGAPGRAPAAARWCRAQLTVCRRRITRPARSQQLRIRGRWRRQNGRSLFRRALPPCHCPP